MVETWILVMFSVSLMFSLLMCHAGKRSKQVSTESTASLPSYLSYRCYLHSATTLQIGDNIGNKHLSWLANTTWISQALSQGQWQTEMYLSEIAFLSAAKKMFSSLSAQFEERSMIPEQKPRCLRVHDDWSSVMSPPSPRSDAATILHAQSSSNSFLRGLRRK